MKMRQIIDEISSSSLDLSCDIQKNINDINHRIVELNIEIYKIDRLQPKFIEDILLKDKIITSINKLKYITNAMEIKNKQIKQSVPFKFRIIYFFKKMFK